MSYIFLLTALLLRVVGNFMTTEIMPETPIEVIHILIVAVVIYAVRLGIETFSRTSEIMLPVILVLFLLFAVLLLKEIDMERIQPVMEWGMKPVLLASFYFFSLQELVVFLMLVPYVNRIDKVRRSWMMGTMLGGVVLLVSILLCILVLGSDFTARNMYPTYTLAKQINVANFLQKVESVIAVIWLITIFFKITISYYAAVLGTAQLLGLKDYRTLTLPLGIILVVLSIVVYKNIVDYIEFTPRVWSVYAMVSMVVIPLLLLLVDLIRSKLKPST
jgi:spore germination protein KB